jgi:hypothetical protein
MRHAAKNAASQRKRSSAKVGLQDVYRDAGNESVVDLKFVIFSVVLMVIDEDRYQYRYRLKVALRVAGLHKLRPVEMSHSPCLPNRQNCFTTRAKV